MDMLKKGNKMRIIAGKYRHLQIEQPKDTQTRPTMDKVREALMSAITFNIIDSNVLDLFSGSGALGFEAISRGAKEAHLVDCSKEAINTIKNNYRTLKIKEPIFIYQKQYQDFLLEAKAKNLKFGLIFLDPPYKMDVYQEVVNMLFDYDLISTNAVIVMECSHHFDNDERFRKVKYYKYGTVFVTIYWR